MNYILLVVLLAILSASAASSQEKAPPPRTQFIQKLKAELKEKKKVFIYFYSDSREQSKIYMEQINKIAVKEKSSVVFVDASSRETGDVLTDYKIMYVPAIVQVEYRRGITGFFHGKTQVDQFFKNKGKSLGLNDKKAKKILDDIEASGAEGKTTIIEFYAPWCGVCERIAPVLKKAEKESKGQMLILRVNMDETQTPAQWYEVDSPPENVVLDSDGVLRGRFRVINDTDELFRYLNQSGL